MWSGEAVPAETSVLGAAVCARAGGGTPGWRGPAVGGEGDSPRTVSFPSPKRRGRMDRLLAPRESAKFIAENSLDVSIDGGGVRRVAELLLAKAGAPELRRGGWKALHELNPRAADEAAVNWVFVADTLNFSFWSEREEHKCLVGYRGRTYSGYWSLCAAINRALDEGRCPFRPPGPQPLGVSLAEGSRGAEWEME